MTSSKLFSLFSAVLTSAARILAALTERRLGRKSFRVKNVFERPRAKFVALLALKDRGVHRIMLSPLLVWAASWPPRGSTLAYESFEKNSWPRNRPPRKENMKTKSSSLLALAPELRAFQERSAGVTRFLTQFQPWARTALTVSTLNP